MSKLIDLISRLGQQSAQPIGFGALTGRVESAPTMALIGVASADDHGPGLATDLPDGVDAIIFSVGTGKSVIDLGDSLTSEDLVWGVSGGSLDNDDVDGITSAGCDFFLIDHSAPASVVGRPDVGMVVSMSEPVDRETAAALRSLKVDGSLNTSGVGSDGLSFGDLVDLVKIGATVGGVMLVEVSDRVADADLAALRDAGVDGLVVSLSETELVGHLAKSIRELPPRRRPESRGLSVSAPLGDG
jgi:hypothetical protein